MIMQERIITIFKDEKKILLGIDKQDEFSIDYIDREYRFYKKI